MLSFETMKLLKEARLWAAKAQAACLPRSTGNGFVYGGGWVVTIGEIAISCGEGNEAGAIAEEIARRWNCIADMDREKAS